jgi:hypothetical protein
MKPGWAKPGAERLPCVKRHRLYQTLWDRGDGTSRAGAYGEYSVASNRATAGEPLHGPFAPIILSRIRRVRPRSREVLQILRDRSAELGRTTVVAAETGAYPAAAGPLVDRADSVRRVRVAKGSLPSAARLLTHDPGRPSAGKGWGYPSVPDN